MYNKKYALFFVLGIFFTVSSIAQKELLQGTLTEMERVSAVKSWIVDSEFLIIDFTFGTKGHVFKVVHIERGEIASFPVRIFFAPENFYGITSTDSDITIYIDGIYQDNRDFYFINFPKNNQRPPLITTWMTKEIKSKNILRYNHENRIFILEKDGDDFELSEVESYDKIKKYYFDNEYKYLYLGNSFYYDHVDNQPHKAIGNGVNHVYHRGDSLIVTMRDNQTPKDHHTKILIFDLKKQKMIMQKFPVLLQGSSYHSLILNDKIYMLEFKRKDLGLHVYKFPDLSLLRTFRYVGDENIAIRTSSLLDESGETLDKEITNEKVMIKLTTGRPYLTVITDSIFHLLQINAEHVYGGGSVGMVGGGTIHTASSFESFRLNACIDNNMLPCDRKLEFPIQKIEKALKKEQESNKRLSYSIVENDFFIYTVKIDSKTNRFSLLQFQK